MNSQAVDQVNNGSTDNKPKRKKTKIQVKAPTQERSRQTVSTILEACSKILIREGFFGVTTDKIAKEAGVSIGSLYQFFGNKESVVSAVIHDMFQRDQEHVLVRARELEGITNLEDKIRKLIEIGVEVYQRNSELRSKLQNIQTYLTDEKFYNNTMRAYQDMVIRELPPLAGRDPQKVAYIVITTFVGLMDRAVLELKDFGKDPQFMGEVHRLFVNFLTK